MPCTNNIQEEQHDAFKTNQTKSSVQFLDSPFRISLVTHLHSLATEVLSES